ncbi:MAG: flagellar hook-length control protein FliK [Vicinamibacterales bacterium]|nr:flagellar hook-length control protein FliK [Vicinamibacterales bacterium]
MDFASVMGGAPAGAPAPPAAPPIEAPAGRPFAAMVEAGLAPDIVPHEEAPVDAEWPLTDTTPLLAMLPLLASWTPPAVTPSLDADASSLEMTDGESAAGPESVEAAVDVDPAAALPAPVTAEAATAGATPAPVPAPAVPIQMAATDARTPEPPSRQAPPDGHTQASTQPQADAGGPSPVPGPAVTGRPAPIVVDGLPAANAVPAPARTVAPDVTPSPGVRPGGALETTPGVVPIPEGTAVAPEAFIGDVPVAEDGVVPPALQAGALAPRAAQAPRAPGHDLDTSDQDAGTSKASGLDAARQAASALIARALAAFRSSEDGTRPAAEASAQVEAPPIDAPAAQALPVQASPVVTFVSPSDGAPVDAATPPLVQAPAPAGGFSFSGGRGQDGAETYGRRPYMPAALTLEGMGASLLPSTASLGPGTAPSAATAPSEAARPSEVPDLTPQFVKSLRLQWRDGLGEARFLLNPEHLGEVSVQLRVGPEGVHASFQSASPLVRGWIQTHSEDLRAALAERGLDLSSVKVHEDPDEDGRERQDRQDDAPRRRQERASGETPSFESLL